MRLACFASSLGHQQEVARFSEWILAIGEGRVPCTAREGESEPSWVKIPNDLLLRTDGDKLSCIFNATYPDFHRYYSNTAYLAQRAILTPINEVADTVNDYVVSLVPGQ